jgi:hypothetical protein
MKILTSPFMMNAYAAAAGCALYGLALKGLKTARLNQVRSWFTDGLVP